MTTKEKAIELLTRYRRHLPINTVTDLEVKGCASIAVDEIQKLKCIGYSNANDDTQYDYWQEVKEEIEKL